MDARLTGRSACSTPGSAVSPSPGPSSTCCRPRTSSTSATRAATRTARSRRPRSPVRPRSSRGASSRDYDVKAVVVACNTARPPALDDLRAELPVPVIDVIEPGAQALVDATAQRAGRRDRHRRHDRLGRLPARRRRRDGAERRRRADVRGVPRLRRVRRARPDRRATRSRSWPSACWPRCATRRRRRAAARLHALPVPRPGRSAT